MTSIVPHFMAATFVTVSYLRPAASVAASRSAASAIGAVILIFAVVACVALLAAIGSAARSMAAALAELARFGSVLVTAFLFTVLIVVALAVLLIR